MTQPDDISIIKQIQSGDTRAYEVLVDRYKDMVFSIALKMLVNREEAEELAQDAFIKVYKSMHTFKGEAKFSTWIYRLTYNSCLDRIKKLKRSQSTVTLEEFSMGQLSQMETVLDEMDKSDRQKSIEECLILLPEEENLIISLYYYEEQSLDEISKIVNLNTNHLKVKLFRIRKKLMSILEQRLEPEIIEQYGKQRG